MTSPYFLLDISRERERERQAVDCIGERIQIQMADKNGKMFNIIDNDI